uniref:Uncharacterized protein n=1 Tax=viral metagenome TaxID=1070528 RepID=A0A6M3J0L1_9ZZZZ
MKKLKVLSAVLVLMLVMAFLVTPVFAQARHGLKTSRPIETTGILTDQDGNAMDYGVWIYGIEIFADEASSYLGIYDCDTATELNSATTYARDEIGEATQYDSKTKWYATPKYYSDGVGMIIFTGVGFAHYGPEPTS